MRGVAAERNDQGPSLELPCAAAAPVLPCAGDGYASR